MEGQVNGGGQKREREEEGTKGLGSREEMKER